MARKKKGRPSMLGTTTLRMLAYLRTNAPVFRLQVAKDLGITTQQVNQKLTSLENNGVLCSLDEENKIHIFKDNPELKSN
jgi:predicted ArsR family transcriptional regulator